MELSWSVICSKLDGQESTLTGVFLWDDNRAILETKLSLGRRRTAHNATSSIHRHLLGCSRPFSLIRLHEYCWPETQRERVSGVSSAHRPAEAVFNARTNLDPRRSWTGTPSGTTVKIQCHRDRHPADCSLGVLVVLVRCGSPTRRLSLVATRGGQSQHASCPPYLSNWVKKPSSELRRVHVLCRLVDCE
jgi:hypothetical protein